jgi:hypothetical protein
MFQTTHTTQVFTLFGGGYVPERRADELGNLAPPDVAGSLTAAMFDKMMQSLRSALSL